MWYGKVQTQIEQQKPQTVNTNHSGQLLVATRVQPNESGKTSFRDNRIEKLGNWEPVKRNIL